MTLGLVFNRKCVFVVCVPIYLYGVIFFFLNRSARKTNPDRSFFIANQVIHDTYIREYICKYISDRAPHSNQKRTRETYKIFVRDVSHFVCNMASIKVYFSNSEYIHMELYIARTSVWDVMVYI